MFVSSSLPECFEQTDASLYIGEANPETLMLVLSIPAGMALGAAPYLEHGVHTFGPLSSRTSIPQLPEGAAEPERCVLYDGTASVLCRTNLVLFVTVMCM